MIPTEDGSARKEEIEAKLEQEEHMLTFIRESLERSDQLASGMVTILSSFESRLVRLENAIIPVHTQTENLQRLQDNVDRTLACLDHVISYYHVAADTEKTVREGPAGRLEEYLGCMAEVLRAVQFFQENSPDSPELYSVKSLFEAGKEQLETEFRGLLTRYSRPVPPQLLLELLGVELGAEQGEGQTVEHLPQAVQQELLCISHWLSEHARNQDYLNVYFQVRSAQLDGSMRGLRDHLCRNNAPPTTYCSPSPALQARRKDMPGKKLPRRPVYFPDFKQSLHAKGALRKVLASQYGTDGRRGSPALPQLEGKDELSEAEMDSYMCCVSAFVKLAQSEFALLCHIVPELHQKKTFDSLIQEALDSLMQEGEGIVAVARRAIGRHDYSIVLSIFPILRHLKQNKTEFDTTLQGTSASTRDKLPALIVSMETIGAKALEEFADFSENTSCVSSSELDRRVLSAYICKALGNLQLNLLSKSKVYDYSALSAIFLLNNYTYILKSLQKSELIALVADTHTQVEHSYQELIEQQVQVYQRSWWRVMDYIMDKNTPTFLPGQKLKDKERQQIKDKFKGFNEGLEELCKVQKAWAIPDREQRQALRLAQSTLVTDAYRSFLHRYANISFTKNLDKYLKYGPEQVEDMIGRLFDTSA
ncbi:hypothetical protein GJAV_G00141220 [Gymnothorax javanicus]|nr:hypothetical protein GJAV_G00141220 [Gymnothorax javanicus]